MALDADPTGLLQQWLSEARAAGENLPEAMALATTRSDGSPAVRMVLMRGVGSDLVFFTDCESQKGDELRNDPRAALMFHWYLPFHRQVRVSGETRRVSDDEADHYWLTRTPAARRTALASQQSQVIADRRVIEQRVAELQKLYGDEPRRPKRWGGYRLDPETIEFWQEGEGRLHDRIRYRMVGSDWESERLSP